MSGRGCGARRTSPRCSASSARGWGRRGGSACAIRSTARATDEAIGTGDGATRRFALVKHYGEHDAADHAAGGGERVGGGGRRGDARRSRWSRAGVVALDVAPAAGAAVTAGFAFDVPVRFAEDRLSVSRATFLAGEAASVPLVEVREA